MRVYFLTKKQILKGIAGGIFFLIAGLLITNLLYRNLAVPTTEVSPIYQGSSDIKQISFVVNVDWGEEYIPEMIDIFNDAQVKVTFFLTGRWTEKFPEIAQLICQNGHEIGNHGYKHDSPNKMTLAGVKDDIKKAEQIIQNTTGKKIQLYAPPSGEREDHVVQAAHELGYQTVLWSVDTIDWKRPAFNIIVAKIQNKAHNGAIVLMHPTEPTIKALPIVIPELKNQGFKFVTVSENIIQIANDKSTNE